MGYGLGIILGVGPRGSFALELLNEWRSSPGLYLCDPFIHIWKGYDEPENLSDKDHQLLFEDLRNRLAMFEGKYSLVRDFSSSFAVTYKGTPGSPPPSMVFIDTNPEYNAIKRDIADWWPTVAQSGILAGANYHRPDVKRAVHEFAQQQQAQVQLFLEPNTWF